MVYSSYVFIFAFLPVVLLLYFPASRLIAEGRGRLLYKKLVLIAASLYFYGYFNPSYLPIIVSSVLVNYALARLMQTRLGTRAGKALFVAGILFNILLLGYYKYYDFFVENVNAVFGSSLALKNILLPLGISFFTFQQLSFLISVWKGEERVSDMVSYSVFVLFFPQLVAGPIVLYSEIIPQVLDEARSRFDSDSFARGVYIFCIGLFKKLVVADTLALFVDNGFARYYLDFSAAWAVSLSYTLQIYFDFSGYSDMAIGIGKMFNIDLPANFLSPYRSESISEFWRRWHITLGRALSTYIYKPLGGSRKGLGRTCINLFLTFLVSGLWHGASWTFVVWGALHGLFAVLERLLKKPLDKIPRPVRVAVTFLIVNALWVLFRAESFQQAQVVYEGMLRIGQIDLGQLSGIVYDGLINFPQAVNIAYILGILLLLLAVAFRCKNSMKMLEGFSFGRREALTTALLFCVSLVHLGRESVFIYFNF